MKKVIEGVEGTREYAQELLRAITVAPAGATVIALSGDLGAGKTTLTQCIARELGITEHITSPTFVIEKVYKLTNQKWGTLIHIDAYRLNDGHELQVLGWDALVTDSNNLIIIEWPERIPDLIHNDMVRIHLEGSGESRTVEH